MNTSGKGIDNADLARNPYKRILILHADFYATAAFE